MALPAFGIISEVVPVFARKPIFGYEFVAASRIAIAFLARRLGPPYVHGRHGRARATFRRIQHDHRRADRHQGLHLAGDAVGRSIRFTTDALRPGVLSQFTIGGLSGVTFAAVPGRLADDDTYYVVAHFHYVLLAASLFASSPGFYYWFPKILAACSTSGWASALLDHGRRLQRDVPDPALRWAVGMPRRVYTYADPRAGGSTT